MRNTAKMTTGIAILALMLGGLLPAPQARAAGGEVPSEQACKDKPTDPVTQGGCIVIDRKLGNCVACHMIRGASMPGNLGPALVDMKRRFPDQEKLREHVWDEAKFNPYTAMPPFGRNHILTSEQIDKVVDFLSTL